MTRRHDALIPLSHDHHHALRHARLLRQAADLGDVERTTAAQAFADFFYEHSVQHFREEEEEIFPLVVRHPNAPLDGITRILHEHVVIHALVGDLRDQTTTGQPSPETMRELASTLRTHIRFEEDELFPKIERLISERLDEVHLPPRLR